MTPQSLRASSSDIAVFRGCIIAFNERNAGVVGAGQKEKEPTFKLSGQVIAAIVVTAVAGNILAARRLRTTLAGMAARSAKRKEEAERIFRERARRADAAFDGNSLRGRVPEGWEFDDGREAAFVDRRLNSRVLRNLSTLGVKNFVAGKAEVKAAYFERAMRLHPDRGIDSALGGGTKHGNEEEFKRIAAAYEWLEEHYFRKR